jgi:hypothetical protein
LPGGCDRFPPLTFRAPTERTFPRHSRFVASTEIPALATGDHRHGSGGNAATVAIGSGTMVTAPKVEARETALE